MITHQFSLSDSKLFAKLSGDNNPIHVDEVIARRLLYGRPVVHGIHVLLRSLDYWVKEKKGVIAFHSLKAKFFLPVFLDRNFQIDIQELQNSLRIELLSECVLMAYVEITYGFIDKSDISKKSFRNKLPKLIPPQ